MSVAQEKQVKHAHTIHHVLFPTTDMDRTAEWYERVLGMRRVPVAVKMGSLEVLLMTNGNFDLHFTPVASPVSLEPYHFALEVEDWDAFIAHLDDLGIAYKEVRFRPQNNSKTSEIKDPDGHSVELVWHGDRDW
jgi:catechol 2,3-dioxygenase-like lactoylglutathione lyase family enzyme